MSSHQLNRLMSDGYAAWMTRWLWHSCPTRSHSELGRERLSRRWYFVLRHGRVGRCLVFQLHEATQNGGSLTLQTGLPGGLRPGFSFLGAGWSSPVARQAHNLKVAGSNPAPATNIQKNAFTAIRLDGGFFASSGNGRSVASRRAPGSIFR